MQLIEDIFIRSIKGCIITASLRQDPAATQQIFFFFSITYNQWSNKLSTLIVCKSHAKWSLVYIVYIYMVKGESCFFLWHFKSAYWSLCFHFLSHLFKYHPQKEIKINKTRPKLSFQVYVMMGLKEWRRQQLHANMPYRWISPTLR